MADGIVSLGEGAYEVLSVDAMRRLGYELGRLLADGDVVVLTGDLGAGKTQLAKGVARAMGVRDEVTSPTFNIQMAYQGRDMPLFHFDLYRLTGADELEDTGIVDVLGDGVCLIEWGEAYERLVGEERLDVHVARMGDEAAEGEEPPRRVSLVSHDPRSAAVVEQLAARLGDAHGERSGADAPGEGAER